MKKALFVMMIGTAALVSSCGNKKAAIEKCKFTALHFLHNHHYSFKKIKLGRWNND